MHLEDSSQKPTSEEEPLSDSQSDGNKIEKGGDDWCYDIESGSDRSCYVAGGSMKQHSEQQDANT